MTTFDYNRIKEQIFKFRDERNWLQFHSPKNLATSVAIEAAELLEHFQWEIGEPDPLTPEKLEQVGEEIADVAVYLMELVEILDLDLQEIIEKKLAKNAAKYPVEKAHNSSKKYTEF